MKTIVGVIMKAKRNTTSKVARRYAADHDNIIIIIVIVIICACPGEGGAWLMCTGKNTKWKLRVQLADCAQKRWRRRRGCFLCYMAVVVTRWVGSHVLQQGGKNPPCNTRRDEPYTVNPPTRRAAAATVCAPRGQQVGASVTRGRQRSHTHTRGSALAPTRTYVPHPSNHSLSSTFKLSGLHAVQTFVLHIII